LKDVIITGGFNVYPREVEIVLEITPTSMRSRSPVCPATAGEKRSPRS